MDLSTPPRVTANVDHDLLVKGDPVRLVRLIAIVSLLGALVTSALFFAGNTGAAAGAFVFGAIALTSGFTALIGPIGNWGMPGDER